jgi:hypothetical protein
MTTTDLFIKARKIHRVFVLVITTLSVLMAVTGIFIKYSSIANFFNLDQSLLRYIHNELSPFFTFTLLLMAATGIYLYLFPYLKKKT